MWSAISTNIVLLTTGVYKLETKHWSTIKPIECNTIVQMAFLILSYSYEVVLMELAKYMYMYMYHIMSFLVLSSPRLRPALGVRVGVTHF
jgi:hypothetical protein